MTPDAQSPPSAPAAAAPWRACFVDAGPALGDLFGQLHRAGDPPVHVNRQVDVAPDELPAVLAGAQIAEASMNLVEAALVHCRRIAAQQGGAAS